MLQILETKMDPSKFFHFHSVSVPFDLPSKKGETKYFEAEFTTPTIPTEDFFKPKKEEEEEKDQEKLGLPEIITIPMEE